MTHHNITIVKVSFITFLSVYACSDPYIDDQSNQVIDSPQTIQTTQNPTSNSQSSPTGMITDVSSIYKAKQPAVGKRIRGKVMETMDASGYTYVSIESNTGQSLWAAGPQSLIKVGDFVDIETNMEMNDFTSNTLGRTFKSIYFVSSFQNVTKAFASPKPKAKFPSLSKLTAKSHATSHTHEVNSPKAIGSSSHVMPSSTPAPKISVTKARDGYTVAEIFAQSKTLAGKEVLVRGQVVKFNEGIMDKNWIHIQDGTGNVSTKDYDLTVTSDQSTAVGNTVLIKAIVVTNKDIGAGYQYPVLLEQATLSNE